MKTFSSLKKALPALDAARAADPDTNYAVHYDHWAKAGKKYSVAEAPILPDHPLNDPAKFAAAMQESSFRQI